jgi:hypothetical protein
LKTIKLLLCPLHDTVDLDQTPLAPSEQKDQKDDHQNEAEAATVVVIGRTGVEATAAEKKNQDNNEDDDAHRSAPLYNFGAIALFPQDNAQQRTVDLDVAAVVVVDESQLPELVHEVAHPGTRRVR